VGLSGIITGIENRKEQKMRFRRIEIYLILGCYLGIGALLGYSIGKEKPQWRPIKKPDTVTVDIVKEGDEILIYEHYAGELVFEYNKNKEVDKTAYKEFEDVWGEVKSYKRIRLLSIKIWWELIRHIPMLPSGIM
jgi:hypothetical protein